MKMPGAPRTVDVGKTRGLRSKRFGCAAVTVSVALVLSACAGGADAVAANNGGQFRFVEATPTGELIGVDERGVAPDFGGTLLDGADYDSTALAGDVSVINFWGSWCGPCRVELPQLQKVYDDVQAQGVSFLGVNVKDGDQQARAFVESTGITFPSIFDPRGEVTLAFRDFPPTAIPSTVLLDRDGRVAAVYVGAVSQDTLRPALDLLLTES